ncbi:hypothetical protein CROQUDRAFT_87909 [Cronartium quercuum f. sp. fusiforme G11]|uniref:Uncharacterized protein n=1 Tax=Cronartium quercuum f. sp. fusiforme G11 TaxID=708437 RepID=A0A9P6NRP2_9BASI|nr:hypothetical protein CROQUDRAFT_87909 [Cronartium quercuum f. sp. fusiforme G11]
MASSTPSSALSAKIQATVQAALASQAQAYESQLAESCKAMLHLEDRLNNLQVNLKAATPQCPKRAGSEPAPNSLKPRLAQTPVWATPAVRFTPKATHKMASQPSGSTPAKKRPNQVTTADYPKGFEGTKEGFTIHIKILWGMLEPNLVPPPADKDTMARFNSSFSTITVVQQAIDNELGVTLMAQAEIETLKDARMGRIKVGRGMINVDEVCIHYIHTSLAKLGISIWGPNLTESPDSLFNSACHIAAIRSFREVALQGPYPNISKAYLNNLTLLTLAYNHFVHYLSAQHFKKELVSPGKFELVTKKAAVLRHRLRLCKARCEFLSTIPGCPKQYIKMLAKPNTHSDDEVNSNSITHTIKTLEFRSANASKLIRQVDLLMQKADILPGKTSQKHMRRLLKTPVPSTFKSPPTQLPIDFYSPSWYNNLPPGQKEKWVDSAHVALLPDAAQSLKPIPHPDESLSGSKFSKKYYEQKIRVYQVLVVKEFTEEHLDKTGNLDCCDEVLDDDEEGIDLQQPSDGEDADDDEYYAEGEFGDLYDQEDGWLVENEDDDNSNDGDFDEEEEEADIEHDWEGDLEMGKTGHEESVI